MTDENLRGIRGWLIVVAIGIVLSPFLVSRDIYSTYHELMITDAWIAVTTPGLETYIPGYKSLVWTEALINCGTVLAWIYIAFQFFMEKESFPRWYIGILVFNVLFLFADALAFKTIFPDETVFVSETTDQLIRSVVTALIWIPYMRISERVKATFIN